MTRPRNLFLTSNFRPVAEEREVTDLVIEGDWPSALQGTLVQAGPNPAFAPEGAYHPFEGSGMLHAVCVEGSRASYRNRFVQTPDYLRERAAGRALVPPIAASPPIEVLESGRYPYRDTGNTLLLPHAGTGWALSDFHAPIQVDPRTLETFARDQVLADEVAPFCGHPKRDPDTGELFYFRSRVGPQPRLTLGGVDRAGRRTFEASVDLPMPRLMHDFVVSKHHAVFLDVGATFDPARARLGQSGWYFERSLPCRLLVVPREGGALRAFAIEPCVVMHSLNAWESDDGRTLTVLVVRYPSLPEVLAFEEPARGAPHAPADANTGRLCAWTIELRTGRVQTRWLSHTPADYPRQDEALLMRPTRRAWLAPHLPVGGVIEVDLEHGRERLLPHGRGRYGGEFLFVRRPDALPECGWLLGFVWDSASGLSEVVLLDTERPEAGPIARIRLPCRVPFGFHASWFPSPGGGS